MSENSTRGPERTPSSRVGRFVKLFGLGKRTRLKEEATALSLPPMTRGMRSFSTGIFFLLGVGLTAFVLTNPLGLTFLPGSEKDTRDSTASMASILDGGPPYHCPMHPHVMEQEPGDCPICGMKLVSVNSGTPARASEGAGGPSEGGSGVIEIDPVQVQNIGVVSELARVGDISRTVRTVGILDFNADLITWINNKFSGWIEKVHVNYVGQEVRKGEPLFEIYSPELVTTQEEYLRALDYKASLEGTKRVEARKQAESLLLSTRDRLLYWDVSEDQIQELEENRRAQRRLTVFSPVGGVVTQIMDEALEGMFVEAGKDFYKIADISALWVHADVYESELPWVRENQPAEVSFRYDPERVFRGEILFLYPEVNAQTRTLKICVEVPNKDRRLRAGMYADVVIYGPPARNAILIPNSAVLRSGERDLVFVDLGEGRFEPREVELGIRGERDEVQIVHGIAAGEAVVTQAQFMLDSESRVQEAITKFMKRGTANQQATPEPPASLRHDSGG